jgi:hypothetical protein
MTAPQPEQQSSLAANVATPDDTRKEGEKLVPPSQVGSTMGDAPGEVKTNTFKVEIVDEIMPAATAVSEPPSCSSSTSTSPTSPSPTPADSMEEWNMSCEPLLLEPGLQKTEARPALQTRMTEQEQLDSRTKPGKQILGHESTEPIHEGMEPVSVLSKPVKIEQGINSRQPEPEDTQPEPMQHSIIAGSEQGAITPEPNRVNPDPTIEEPSPVPNQEVLSHTCIKPESQ